jgi:hypothetical protein
MTSRIMFKKILFIVGCCAFFLPGVSHAATFNLISNKDQIIIGDQLYVDLKIDTENMGTNTAQATIQFPVDILSSTTVDRANSVFNFWLLEPKIDATRGEITFVGGSDNGFSGSSLQVFRIGFKVKGSGVANIVITDGAITASDGSGTNLFSASKGLQFTVLAKSTANILKQISREASLADNLPVVPDVSVSLYPDPKKWNNSSGYFTASWKLPPDISGVATEINKYPSFNPVKSEGLFDNKSFPVLSEGIWYLHVRFKNNIGWGVTNHYRIALDTTPPLAFTVKTILENPYTPTLSYKTNDQLSGIKSYIVKIDNDVGIETNDSTYLIKDYFPGDHIVKVFAEDQAGNRTESTLKINILGIPSPRLIFVTKDVFAGEGGLSIIGTASAFDMVEVSLKNANGAIVYSYESIADKDGQWMLQIPNPLSIGAYILELYSKNSEGALSSLISIPINAKERPFISIFGLEIGKTLSIIILIIILIITFISGFLSNRSKKEQRIRKEIIASRDVNNILNLILHDLEIATVKHKDKDPIKDLELIRYWVNRVKENIKKMRKYLIDNINEIN